MRSITINNQTYPFKYNLFDIVKVKASNETEIKTILDNAKKICINFDNSSQIDAPYFSVVGFNLVFRITRFYAIEGEQKEVKVCKDEPKILFLGPHTGAVENSVALVNQTIIVQGTTPKDFEMAADKLSLIIFGIDEQRLEELWLLRE